MGIVPQPILPRSEVTIIAAPDSINDYAWGDKSLKFIRCRHCGCVMQWKSLTVGPDSNTGVNARNFDPPIVGTVKVRLLDGADTWEYLD